MEPAAKQEAEGLRRLRKETRNDMPGSSSDAPTEIDHGSLEAPVPWCSFETRKKIMNISIYGSNLILMVAPLSFLFLRTSLYALLSVIPLLALLVIIVLYRHGCSPETYEEHKNNLDQFMTLSTGGTLLAVGCFVSFVFVNPPLLKQSHVIKVSECFLYCSVVIGLLIMLLISVPPKAPNLVEVLKSMCNTLLALLMLVGLMATAEILQGFVMIAIFLHIFGATIWLIKELRYEGELLPTSSGPQQDVGNGLAQPAGPEHDEDGRLMFTASFTLGVIFYFYSNYQHYRDEYTHVQLILLWVFMTILCSTFISSLSRMLIISNSDHTRAWTCAKEISYYITYSSVLVMLIGLILLGFMLLILMPR